ncbi:MAG: hypothetical protein H0X24_24495 [Ktedonobacterales bacterium]|nr:hypothetical protein [Ktedonobacterales bacterium]
MHHGPFSPAGVSIAALAGPAPLVLGLPRASSSYLWRRGPDGETLRDTAQTRERIRAMLIPNSRYVFALGLMSGHPAKLDTPPG